MDKSKNKDAILNLEEEFAKLYENLVNDLEVLCLDLHAIQLALINLPDYKQIKGPNPYISYFLKAGVDAVISHANQIQPLINRTNNNFAFNIISTFEDYLKHGYALMMAIQKQETLPFTSESFKNSYDSNFETKATLGVLTNNIKTKINSIDEAIIPNGSPHYEYCKNYILLRNCLAHKSGEISKAELNMEIRLPLITEQQLKEHLESGSDKPISPQTTIKKWSVGEKIQLELSEVEGIAYGLTKISFELFQHMYKATDKRVAALEKNAKI